MLRRPKILLARVNPLALSVRMQISITNRKRVLISLLGCRRDDPRLGFFD